MDGTQDRMPLEPLDLPDWSAADHRAGRVTVEAGFSLCERYAAGMPATVRRLRAQRPPPCPVEFVPD